MISGCLPSHLPLANARKGISGGAFTKHAWQSAHMLTASSPSKALCEILLLWSSSPRISPQRAISTLDALTSSGGTLGQALMYCSGSSKSATSSGFLKLHRGPASTVGTRSSLQRPSAQTTQASQLLWLQRSFAGNSPVLASSCSRICGAKFFHCVSERT